MDLRLIVSLSLFVWTVDADNEGDCILSFNHTTVTTDQWNFGFQLEDSLPDNATNGTIIVTFQSTNIIGITSSSSQFFSPVFNNKTGNLSIVLSQLIDETKYVVESRLSIKVIFKCNTDTANIYIYVPIEDVNDHQPTFDSTNYKYNLPMPFPSGIDITAAFGDIYATDVDFTNTRIDFSLDTTGNKLFNTTSRTEGKEFFVMLKSKTRIDESEDITFYITATDSGIPPLQSSVMVTITRDSQYSTQTSPLFKEPIYISKVEEVNSAGRVPVDIIIEDGYTTNLTLQLMDIGNGNWSNYFKVSNTWKNVDIQLINQLPQDLFNNTNAIIIVQATQLAADHVGQTTLLITGPCSSSTPDYPPPSCPGITLHFVQDEYTVLVQKNQSGLIAELKVVTDHKYEVVFGISSDDEVIKRIFRVSSQYGLLYADEPLANPVVFEFNVTADINSTKEHAYTKVTVKVVNSSSDIQTPKFTKSMEIFHINEETTDVQISPDIIFPTEKSQCSFAIKSQKPAGDFFSISDISGIVTVVNKIDREADIFADMTQAAITLNLQIVCSSALTSAIQEVNVTESILNDPLQTTLIIYIDDINDNAPNFGTTKMTVGYPAEELALRLQPKAIATVTASDKDLDVNAEIKYSLISNVSDKVLVHPKTGSIYPLEGFTFEDLAFNILAQDQNGIEGCNNATLEFDIKILSVNDVTVLWIKDAVIEDLPEVLNELRNGSKYVIQVTDSAVMPYSSQSTTSNKLLMRAGEKMSSNLTSSLLRLIIYAVDTEDHVVSEESLLKDLTNTSIIKTASSASALMQQTEVKKENTALIVAIVILASALIIILFSSTIALYLVYVRPRRVNGSSYTNEFGSQERINKNMEPTDHSHTPMDTSENDTQSTSSTEIHNNASVITPVITLTEANHSDIPPAPPMPLEPPSPLEPPAPPVPTPVGTVEEKKSPAPRERKRSQPVRGDLIPDCDKLLSYRKHKPKDEEDLPDPSIPGGGAPMPREPRQPGGEPIERKRSTVRFSPVIESIDK